MNTYFDFITHVKGVEYIIAILFIFLFILYWEFLKPKPFSSLAEHLRDDAEYIKREGWRGNLRSAKAIITAPLIGLLYIIALPFIFIGVLILIAFEMLEQGLTSITHSEKKTLHKPT